MQEIYSWRLHKRIASIPWPAQSIGRTVAGMERDNTRKLEEVTVAAGLDLKEEGGLRLSVSGTMRIN